MACVAEIFESARHFRIEFESGRPIRIWIESRSFAGPYFFFRYSTSKNVVTLKSWSKVTEGHQKTDRHSMISY